MREQLVCKHHDHLLRSHVSLLSRRKGLDKDVHQHNNKKKQKTQKPAEAQCTAEEGEQDTARPMEGLCTAAVEEEEEPDSCFVAFKNITTEKQRNTLLSYTALKNKTIQSQKLNIPRHSRGC